MNYLDNLEETKQKIEEKNKIEFETQRKRTQEIEEVTKQINHKYDDIISQNKLEKDKLTEKYYKTAEVIEKYSTFNTSTLGQVIAELISIYKQEQYQYISYSDKIKLYFSEYILDTVLVITPAYAHKEYLIDTYKYVDKNNYSLVAFKDNRIPANILFTVYTKDNSLLLKGPAIKYNIVYNDDINDPKNFIFIKEFVDYVINYRIENKISFISLEELEALKDEFINSHQAEIEEYHKNNNLTLKREK